MATNVSPSITDDQIMEKLSLLYPKQVNSVQRIQNVKKMWDLLKNRDKTLDQLEHAEVKLRENSERPTARIFPRIWSKVDAIDHFSSELETQDTKIDHYREKVCRSA